MNSVRSTTHSSVYLVMRHIFPQVPLSVGAFVPLLVTGIEVTFPDAHYPRPVSGCAAEVSQRIGALNRVEIARNGATFTPEHLSKARTSLCYPAITSGSATRAWWPRMSGWLLYPGAFKGSVRLIKPLCAASNPSCRTQDHRPAPRHAGPPRRRNPTGPTPCSPAPECAGPASAPSQHPSW